MVELTGALRACLPLRTGVITTSSLINSTDSFSANEFADSLLQDRVFRLSVTQ